MSSPKEKAEELMYKFHETPLWLTRDDSKHCALICANEVMKHAKDISMVYDLTFDESTTFWAKVKTEIEKL